MRKKQINKALKSDRPINGLYALIPDNKRKAFLKFARRFGFNEEKIKSILANEE